MPNRTHVKTALILGVLIGWIWLYPVFVAPNGDFMEDYHASLWRYARSTSLLPLAFLCDYRACLRSLMSSHNFIIHFLFLAFPFLSLCVVPEISFLLYACAPIWLSGLSFLVLAGLCKADRQAAMVGVSGTAFCFLILGLVRFGLEETTFYGRGRIHMGFIHPTFSAAAIASSSYFLFIVTTYFMGRRSAIAACFHLFNFVLCGWLLFIADSRNFFLAYCLFLGSLFAITFARGHEWLHKTIKIGLIWLFIAFMTYSAFADKEGSFYNYLNNASSMRIELNSKFFNALGDKLSLASLWGETTGLPTGSIANRKTFVSYDSVLVTTLSNFGLLFSLLFYLWYLLRGISAYRSKSASNFAAWTTFFFVSIFDAQGLTPSNILIFFLLFRIYMVPYKGEKCLHIAKNQATA